VPNTGYDEMSAFFLSLLRDSLRKLESISVTSLLCMLHNALHNKFINWLFLDSQFIMVAD